VHISFFKVSKWSYTYKGESLSLHQLLMKTIIWYIIWFSWNLAI